MSLTVERIIGDTKVVYTSEGRDLKEDIVKVTWLTNAPQVCSLCGSSELMLQGRVTKDKEGEEFIYTEFKCKKCFASATLGEYKNPKGALFIKPFKAYERVVKAE